MAKISTYSRITDDRVTLNGAEVAITPREGSWLGQVYHSLGLAYPKFFKMDNLCKAGFLASALVLENEGADHETPRHDTSIVFMNRSSSLDDDTAYEATIADPENYFPSPAVFVYTLANIVTGEVAIRYKIMGETSFLITECFSAAALVQAVEGAFSDPAIDNVLCGWTEYMDGHCDCLVMMVRRDNCAPVADNLELEFNERNINNLYLE